MGDAEEFEDTSVFSAFDLAFGKGRPLLEAVTNTRR